MDIRTLARTAWDWLRRKGRAAVDFVTTGDDRLVTWPPVDAADRLRRYQENAQLYRGEHEAVYVGSYKWSYDSSREYVTVNMLSCLSDLVASRLFGEGIAVTAPQDKAGTQEFLEHIYEHNQLERVNLNGALGASYRGDTCYKVRYDGDARRIVVETFAPSKFFPEFDPLDETRMMAANIAQVLHGDDTAYLWIERHELRDGAGWIVNKLWRLREDTWRQELRFDPEADEVDLNELPQTEALPAEQPTGVDGLLVVYVANAVTDETGPWGVSDYAELIALQGEINNRYTQRAEVLDKHTDPMMFGPDVADEFGNVRVTENKYLAVPPGYTGTPAGYIIWDAQLDAVEEEIRDLKESFAAVAGIDYSALVPSEGGGPVSGRALRLAQMKTQTAVRSRQATWGPSLQQVFSLATRLATAPGVVLKFKPTAGTIETLEPDEIAIGWQDGLPADRMEDIEEQTSLLTAGLQTKQRAVAALYGMAEQDAADLVAKIAEEAGADRVMAPGATNGNALGLTLGPAFEQVPPDGAEDET